jgi:ABC-type nickel/cobalt efflux system permease component RcnA
MICLLTIRVFIAKYLKTRYARHAIRDISFLIKILLQKWSCFRERFSLLKKAVRESSKAFAAKARRIQMDEPVNKT